MSTCTFFKKEGSTRNRTRLIMTCHFRLRAKVKQGVGCWVNARRCPWSRQIARRGSWRGKCRRRLLRRGRCSPTRCAPAEIRAESGHTQTHARLQAQRHKAASHGPDDSGMDDRTSSTSATICSTAEATESWPRNHEHTHDKAEAAAQRTSSERGNSSHP